MTVIFVIIWRLRKQTEVSGLDLEQDSYLNLFGVITEHKNLIFIDSFNVLLMFTTLFYHTAHANESLFQFTTFLVQIAKKILSQIVLLVYLISIFAVVVFLFFEQTIEEMNDFSSAVISAISLSLGNGVLNEREILISDMGEHVYNIVSPACQH